MLKHKGHAVVSVNPTTTVADLATVLAERRIGAVVVVDDTGDLRGVVSERDIVTALAGHGAAALDMTAAALMTRDVVTATRHTTVEHAMALMTEGRFRHLPVLDAGRLIGIVSIGDVVKARMTAQEGEVESLRAYVAGAA
jgi:CBS domain-containing protein